jgi:hypothetical protein
MTAAQTERLSTKAVRSLDVRCSSGRVGRGGGWMVRVFPNRNDGAGGRPSAGFSSARAVGALEVKVYPGSPGFTRWRDVRRAARSPA